MSTKRNLVWSISVVLALACMQAANARGQESNDKPEKGADVDPGLRNPGESGDAKTLDTVSVTGNFIQSNARSVIKMDVPVGDVPFSVSSYSSEFMDAVGSKRLGDMYNYMVGVSRSGNSASDITIRGFSSIVSDRNTIMVNGLPGVGSRGGTPSTATVESIEVVKGPASVLYGRAQPGGFVNLITKKPQQRRAASFDLRLESYMGGGVSFGEDNGIVAGVDFTGPLDSENRFLYRFIAEYGDNDSFRDYAGAYSYLIAPSLTWNISYDTTATFAFEHRKQRASFDSGLTAPDLDITRMAPYTTRYQEPSDFQEDIGSVFSASLTHSISDDWKYYLNLRAVQNTDEIVGFESQSVRPDMVTLRRTDRHQYNQREYYTIDSNVSGAFDTGTVSHNLLIGMTVGREKSDTDRIRFLTTPALDVNLYNPVYGLTAPGNQPPQSRRASQADPRGLYITDLVTFSDHWKGVVGLRYEEERQHTDEIRLAPSPVSSKSSDVLPMAGLIYKPTEEWSIYTSFSSSFTPPAANAQPMPGASALVPQTGKQIEGGVKYESAGNKGSATFSLFRIDKEDVLVSLGGGFFSQVGAERVNGAEIEFNLRPWDGWQVGGGYALIDSEIVDDVVQNMIGSPMTNSPKHSVNLLTQYEFQEGALRNFGVGAGVVYRSERIGTLPTATSLRTLPLPSYLLFDLSLFYRSDSYDVSLKLANVFDEKYLRSADTIFRIYPGDPRQLMLSVRKHF